MVKEEEQEMQILQNVTLPKMFFGNNLCRCSCQYFKTRGDRKHLLPFYQNTCNFFFHFLSQVIVCSAIPSLQVI